MMPVWQLQRILARPFDWILSPFGDVHPLFSLALVSLLASVILLLAFRWVSDQTALREVKDRIHAHFLELKLFRHDVSVIWSAEKQILRYNLLYLTHLVTPLLVTLPVLAWFLVSLEPWFSSRPLRVGEAAIVSIFVKPEEGNLLRDIHLAGNEGLEVETPALRTLSENRADWRVRALAPGEYQLEFLLDREGTNRLKKLVRVSRERIAPVARSLSDGGWLAVFENSQEVPLPPTSGVERIEVDYPEAEIVVRGWAVNWVVGFLVFSLVFAFLLKRPFGLVL
ncbi:MAG: hypothetical protein EHM61_01630 [Acidobacteria bacterium]|nr:MAG: hypothetical protein EHM61_01630 [Acidobacteriota bacterium]